MIHFERGAREIELQKRTTDFIRDVVIPYERDPRLTRHGPSADLVNELRLKAREAGLLAFDTLFGGSAHHYRRHAALGGRAHA